MTSNADDNTLYTVHKDIDTAINIMQLDLNLVVKHLFNNSIKLNAQKIKAIVFKNPRVHFNEEHKLKLLIMPHPLLL